jgi:hypothetical protein
MSGQFKETQRMSERRGIDHDMVVLAAFQHVTQRQQASHLRHAGQRGIQQRRDFFAVKKCTVFYNVEDAFAIAFKEFFELAVAIDLPDGDFALGSHKTMRALRQMPIFALRDFQHVRQRMRGIGGHQERRLARVARRKMQRQRARDGRLAYTAFPYDKCQPGHRVIVCGELDFHRNGREGRKEF